MPDSPPLRTTRRRVLAATAALGVAVVGTSGCEVVAPADDPVDADPGTTPSPTATPEEDADEELVARVVAEVSDALAVVEAAGRGRPPLKRSLQDLARTHRAHLAELADSPTRSRRARVGGDDAAALRRVRIVEQRLQGRLGEAAVDAQSGPLAALLASMAAAIAQQLASGALA